jgi:uncharacterized protein
MSTSLAFYATTLVDFQAVAELGFIAGSGVLLCAISCIVLMPPLIVLTRRLRKKPDGQTVSGPFHLSYSRPWLADTLRHPKRVIVIAALLLVASAILASQLKYDHNLLHMQSQQLESVRREHKLLERTTGNSWNSTSIADTPEQAIELRKRFEQRNRLAHPRGSGSQDSAPGEDRTPHLTTAFARQGH